MSTDPRWHSLGAFRGCDAHTQDHAITYAAITEVYGPAAVAAMIAAGDRAGMLCPPATIHPSPDACYAVLDVVDVEGDTIGDRCIPTRAAFDWWVRGVELRATSSDCPVDEPTAYAATYAIANA